MSSSDAPSLAEPIAELRGVSKRFGAQVVLDKLSLSFERGKTTVILGPSGAGKSVLIKHLVGLLAPDAGEVRVDGERVDGFSEREFNAVRRKVGYMFQLGALFDSMTVAQNIAFPLLSHTQDSPEERLRKVREVLHMVGLDGFEDRYPTQISGGQQRRVALARAIVLRPRLMLYDEPTTGLDPMRSDVIGELICALNRHLGISSIVVTHDMNLARKVADRMVLLYNGLIKADARRDAFLATEDPLVRRFIHGQAEEHELSGIQAAISSQPAAPSSQSPPPPPPSPPPPSPSPAS